MYAKIIPREMAVTAAEDTCNLVDGFFFIWMSMIRLDASTKGAWQKISKKASMENKDDGEIDGDGVVTLKTHEEKKWCILHVNGNMIVIPGKACIPPVTYQVSWEINLGDRGCMLYLSQVNIKGRIIRVNLNSGMSQRWSRYNTWVWAHGLLNPIVWDQGIAYK